MDEIISTRQLSKQYKDVLAVSNMSLNVGKGEIYGFLGLNGAGKTTTIRMLLGMIKPTSGKAFIKGKEVYADNTALWKDVGYMVEVPYAYPDLTVRENLELIRRLRFIDDKHAVDAIMEKLELTKYAKRRAMDLSLGNSQRLGLAKALIHNPDVLLLDEPSNGLDPSGIYEIRELLTHLAAEHGVTIFISSHILNEISRFATRIGIIHEGVLIRELNKQQLDEMSNKRLLVNTRDNSITQAFLTNTGMAVSLNKEGHLEISDNSAIEHPEAIATMLVQNDDPPSMLSVVEEDLESFFLRTIASKNNSI